MIQPVHYFTGTFHLGTKLIWTLFLLVNSELHSLDSDYLLIVSKLKLGDGLDQMQYPFEERRFTSCHILEDVFHFVLECSRYNDLRTI